MKKQTQFKAGDKVKVLSSECSPHYAIDRMIGGIFEVKEYLDTYGFEVKVWNADKSDFWYFHEHEVELVNSSGTEEINKSEINETLFHVETFLLTRFINTDDKEYYKQATILLDVRRKLFGE